MDIVIIFFLTLLYIYGIFQTGNIEKSYIRDLVLMIIILSLTTAGHFLNMEPIFFLSVILVVILFDIFYDREPFIAQYKFLFGFGLLLEILLTICYFTNVNTYIYSVELTLLILYFVLSIKRKDIHVVRFILMAVIYLILISLSIVSNIYLNMRGWRHDYHNHLQTMKAYLSMDKIQALINYLNILEDNLTNVDSYIKSGNLLVDAILNSKLSIAKDKNIKINCKADLPKNIVLSDIDMCIILGNLLDNAIEACELIEKSKRFLRVYLTVHKNQLYISIQNSAKKVWSFVIKPTNHNTLI